YSQFAATYFDSTVSLDLTPLYERFLNNLPSGALILDLGCGSGRDTKHFLANGYRVHAIDACPELAALATKHTGNKVELASFHDITTESRYDAIWACASRVGASAIDAAIRAIATARRARRCQAAALRRMALMRAAARFPERLADFSIAVISVAVASGPCRRVPARKNRHGRRK
ncbi:MAG: class I SAM-dependent methyltransferase, partial [Planctomycetia bacterium]|nr:class I SAM-dependent methyltransferase [Planctomycetia bacterium]